MSGDASILNKIISYIGYKYSVSKVGVVWTNGVGG